MSSLSMWLISFGVGFSLLQIFLIGEFMRETKQMRQTGSVCIMPGLFVTKKSQLIKVLMAKSVLHAIVASIPIIWPLYFVIIYILKANG